jgi:phosphopantothenoylcysteine decarboxylase/phosphopantothenate--cysteine ligase
MGPTQQAIDPVRFISNHSSGKMGLAIAQAFKARGATVFLVSGPVSIEINPSDFHLIRIKSAEEMYEASKKLHSQMDICVFAAAVADYAPAQVAPEKIKKQDSEMSILLKKNVDIAFELGKMKRIDQIYVGFALETEQEEVHAKAKLDKKNFDLIVLNSAKEEGAGFQHDTNRVKIFHRAGQMIPSGLLPKAEVAELILDEVKKTPIWI